MTANQPRSNAILPFASDGNADLTGKEGFPVKLISASGRIALIGNPLEAEPFGVILAGRAAPEKNSVALSFGGLAGTVRLKLAQDVTDVGGWLQVVTAIGITAFGPENAAVDRRVCAIALEAGAAGELIEAVLFRPLWRDAE